MMITVPDTCSCGTIGRLDVRLCAEHHRYWNGDRELASVSKVLRSTWPIPADFSRADPAVLENARERGVLVDHLFSAYVSGRPLYIPRGTRDDPTFLENSKNLFHKLRTWWDASHKGDSVSAQKILANDEFAGMCDLIIGGGVWDLKTTYDLEVTYPLQVGLYGLLYESMYNRLPDELGIIHVTERYAKPRIIELPVGDTLHDAHSVLQMYRLIQRRTA